jgi:Major Facilitator Superfamily
MWHGIAMIMYGSGVGLGGVIGGVINESWGWRWAFLALTPLTVISGVGVAFFLPALRSSKEQSLGSRLKRIDFSGSAVLILATALLLIGLNQEDLDAASSRRILETVLPLAAGFFVIFVVIELRYAREPVIPIDLLGKRTVFGACVTGWFASMSLYTQMFYVPLYLQLRGYNTSETGLRLVPESIGVAIGSFSAGLIMRLTGSYGILKTFALALSIAGNAGFATVSIGTPLLLPEIYLFLGGLGLGGTLTVILLALLSSVNHEQQAVTTSILYAFRSTGATLGISLSSVVFRKLLQSRLGEFAIPGALHSDAMPGDLGDVLRRCNRSNRNRPDDCVHLIDGYMYALHATFLLAVGFAVAGFFSGMVTKNYQLRTSFESEETEDAGHVNCRASS